MLQSRLLEHFSPLSWHVRNSGYLQSNTTEKMKLAIATLVLAALGGTAVAETKTLVVWESDIKFIHNTFSDGKVKLIVEENDATSTFVFRASDGRARIIKAGSEKYKIVYKSSGAIRRVRRLDKGGSRSLGEKEEGYEDIELHCLDEDDDADEDVMFDAHRELASGVYPCEDCEVAWEEICGIGLSSVCDLVDYGIPLASLGEDSIQTVCETFGTACERDAAEVCQENQCVDSCNNECYHNAICENGDCVCPDGYEGDPREECTGTIAMLRAL